MTYSDDDIWVDHEPSAPKGSGEYITVSRLKDEYGFTDGMVTQYLGQPDKMAPNPHYRSVGGAMRLYKVSRIEEIAKTAVVAKRVKEVLAGRQRRDDEKKRRKTLLTDSQRRVLAPEENLRRINAHRVRLGKQLLSEVPPDSAVTFSLRLDD